MTEQSGKKQVQAEDFLLVTGNGEFVGGIGTMAGTPVLDLVDKRGTIRMCLHLEVVDSEPALMLSDVHGKKRVSLFLSLGEPSLSFYDEQGNERAAIGLCDGEPALEFFNEDGSVRWKAP